MALERVRKEKPQVAVLDIVMPEMNGIEAAYEINRFATETKVILISSYYTPQEADLLARLFGDGTFIQKSEVGKQLITAINRFLPEESRGVTPSHLRAGLEAGLNGYSGHSPMKAGDLESVLEVRNLHVAYLSRASIINSFALHPTKCVRDQEDGVLAAHEHLSRKAKRERLQQVLPMKSAIIAI